MINSLLRWVIPATALTAGLGAANLLGTQNYRPELETRNEVAEQFSQLPTARQEQLISRAEFFQTLKTSPEEFARIRDLHAKVSGNPDLAEKLDQFQEWRNSLDPLDRQRLHISGSTDEEWVSEVQQTWQENEFRSHSISVKLWTPENRDKAPKVAHFTEQAYADFLRDIIPVSLSPGLEERFGRYQEPGDKTLAETIAIFRELRRLLPFSGRGSPTPPESSFISLPVLKQAMLDHLVSSEDAEQLRQASDFAVLPFLRAAFDHYSAQFRINHFDSQEEELLALFETLDSAVQLELMKSDPDESRNKLKSLLISKLSSEQPEIARLAEEVSGLTRVFDEVRRSYERSRFGGKLRGGSRFGGGVGDRGRDETRPRDDARPTRNAGDRPDDLRSPPRDRPSTPGLDRREQLPPVR